jgi:hypothetical protein
MDEVMLLRTLVPSGTAPTPAEVTAARTAVLGHIDQRSQRRVTFLSPMRPPSFRRSTLLAVGILLVAVSAVGAALYLGEFGPVDHPATASQIEAEITSTMAVTALPAGQAYPVDALRARAEPAGNLTVFAGVQQVQFYAMCAWSGAWLDADRSGDAEGAAQAVKVISTFPTWKAVSDTRLADESIRKQVRAVVAAAQDGDRGPVQGMFDAMTCKTILVK